MPKPIDSENVIAWLNAQIEKVQGGWLHDYGFPTNVIAALTDAKRFVKNLPTVKAEPARHGRWIKQENGLNLCSVCGVTKVSHLPYCGHCGARMDGGDDKTVNRWISVEDTLPEKDKSYITYAETTKYCNHNEIPEESRINVLYFNGEEWYDERCIYYNVTHYMPLPEPPKE